jgi:chromosome segregation ATPase
MSPHLSTHGSLEEASGEESRLRSKQGRQVQFQSKSERDKAITTEIKQVQHVLSRKEGLLRDVTSQTSDLDRQIAKVETEITDLREKLDGRKEAIESLAGECRSAEDLKGQLDDERR